MCIFVCVSLCVCVCTLKLLLKNEVQADGCKMAALFIGLLREYSSLYGGEEARY